jgi:hypothetical protein
MNALLLATRHVVVMSDTRTQVGHLVTDEAVSAGRSAGRYAGVCGAEVLPGSLKEDTERYCRTCMNAVKVRARRHGE